MQRDVSEGGSTCKQTCNTLLAVRNTVVYNAVHTVALLPPPTKVHTMHTTTTNQTSEHNGTLTLQALWNGRFRVVALETGMPVLDCHDNVLEVGCTLSGAALGFLNLSNVIAKRDGMPTLAIVVL